MTSLARRIAENDPFVDGCCRWCGVPDRQWDHEPHCYFGLARAEAEGERVEWRVAARESWRTVYAASIGSFEVRLADRDGPAAYHFWVDHGGRWTVRGDVPSDTPLETAKHIVLAIARELAR